jgi:hypothetical protein
LSVLTGYNPEMTRNRKLFLLSLLAVLLLIGGPLAYTFTELPSVDTLPQHLRQPGLRITDRNGRLLYQVLTPDSGRNAVVSLDWMDLIIY